MKTGDYDFDKEVVKKMQELLEVEVNKCADDHVVAIPYHEHQRFLHKHMPEKIGTKMEMFADRHVSLILYSSVDGYPTYNIVHHAAMRGHKVFFKKEEDFYLLVLHKDDLLINRGVY